MFCGMEGSQLPMALRSVDFREGLASRQVGLGEPAYFSGLREPSNSSSDPSFEEQHVHT